MRPNLFLKRTLAAAVAMAAALAGALASEGAEPASSSTLRGPCDASAAAALDALHFVVANDENDVLAIYRRGSDDSVATIDVASFLGTRAGEESDLEGAARIGDRIYWITSHGRNSRGKAQPSRHRLFATDVRAGATQAAIVPVGQPYRDLLRDLVEAPALARYRLADAARLAAEADGGLNIEGLAATPDGRLLVGFRNPLRQGKALVVPIDNPREVVAGQRARLGTPFELDLGARGIRAMVLTGNAYVIAAGPIADDGTFALYRWSGDPADRPVPMSADLGTLRPEALLAFPGDATVTLLSDDGGLRVDGKECKDLPPARQAFRTLTVSR